MRVRLSGFEVFEAHFRIKIFGYKKMRIAKTAKDLMNMENVLIFC